MPLEIGMCAWRCSEIFGAVRICVLSGTDENIQEAVRSSTVAKSTFRVCIGVLQFVFGKKLLSSRQMEAVKEAAVIRGLLIKGVPKASPPKKAKNRIAPAREGHHMRCIRNFGMILFDFIVGFIVVGLLTALIALMFSKRQRNRTTKANQREGRQPRNKANMDQPQEEFIEPEGASTEQDRLPRSRVG